MKQEQIKEIIDCLPGGKTYYYYFQHAYALKLLMLSIQGREAVSDIKRSTRAPLLNNPLIKPIVASCGDGYLSNENLQPLLASESKTFLLSLTEWGSGNRSWDQVSRPGKSLVLQLNLNTESDQRQRGYIDKYGHRLINQCGSHPVKHDRKNKDYRETLAWARIDVDFNDGEALIEEIQSDVVRELQWDVKRACNKKNCHRCQMLRDYYAWFTPYQKLWSEAMLSATIEFLVNELGIKTIYTHTDKSGWRIKNMDKSYRAPKSLYTALPKKFTFKKTYNAPYYLLREKSYNRLLKNNPDLDFYRLDI